MLQRGERHFLKLSVSLSPSPSSFMARNQSGQRLWFRSTGFFFFLILQSNGGEVDLPKGKL